MLRNLRELGGNRGKENEENYPHNSQRVRAFTRSFWAWLTILSFACGNLMPLFLVTTRVPIVMRPTLCASTAFLASGARVAHAAPASQHILTAAGHTISVVRLRMDKAALLSKCSAFGRNEAIKVAHGPVRRRICRANIFLKLVLVCGEKCYGAWASAKRLAAECLRNAGPLSRRPIESCCVVLSHPVAGLRNWPRGTNEIALKTIWAAASDSAWP